MKVLSVEQMNQLKELGVDVNPKGMCLIYTSDSSDNYYLKYGESTCEDDVVAFGLHDIIELLPKSISNKYEVLSKTYEDTYVLVWDMEGGVLKYCDDIGCEREYTNHAIIHVNEIGILESLYQMLVWVAENGYLKTK